MLEHLTASQLPRALADLARLRPGATLEVLRMSSAAMRDLEPAAACHDAEVLPTLPDVEPGLARHPRSEGDPLIDAVETAHVT
ncbi:hypothetical protein ACWDSD_36815 [Streptomyces spiralis]